MDFRNFFKNKLFSVNNNDFNALALELFQHQAANNPVYRKYLHAIACKAEQVQNLTEIPYLPVEIFKSHTVITGSRKPEIIFNSSSTGASGISKHYVSDLSLYESNFENTFRQFYGDPAKYTFLALLPSYLERQGSSLVYMMQRLIDLSGSSDSGFYLYDHGNLAIMLSDLHKRKIPCLLFGVSFALLDFAEKQHYENMENLIVMETGGMKGRRKELTREEVHLILQSKLGVESIHSEYGMTELLSQAYSQGGGIFKCPPWMKVLIRDTHDPFHVNDGPSSGALNIIDLANIDSCAFLATSDLGSSYEDGTFTVTGRFDYSEVRGCNLMVL